jgi:hypothetical protein
LRGEHDAFIGKVNLARGRDGTATFEQASRHDGFIRVS